MKNLVYSLIISVFISSCGSGPAGDKQSQLDSLIKEQTALNEEIKTLREELKEENNDNTASRLVEVSRYTRKPFRHYVDVQAKVDGDESVNVSARTQGIVTSILVDEGDQVTKGQVLASLDDQVIRQSLAEVETQLSFATNIYEKQKNLWDQKIGSEVQFLTAKNNKEALERKLASVNEQIDLTRIKSPVNGTIDNVAIKVGQAVMPGAPAMTVVNLNNLIVKGEVGESYAGKIKKGDDVILYFPDLDQEVKAKVGFTSRMINAMNRTFNVEVPLESKGSRFSPNMIVVMKVADYKNDSSLVIPIDLLQRSGEGYYVMTAVKENGKLMAQRKQVEIGQTYNGQAEVLSGISESDELVTTGYRDLNDGQEIRLK